MQREAIYKGATRPAMKLGVPLVPLVVLFGTAMLLILWGGTFLSWWVALGVVMAASGYPLNPRKGDPLSGLPPDADDAMVFHAGTVPSPVGPITSGGRVLCVTALGDSVKIAQQNAYDLLRGIHFDGAQYRRDIGYRAIKR